MGQVSILEVEEDRRNEAAHMGALQVLSATQGTRVRTGLETTQDPTSTQVCPLSKARREELLRRSQKRKNTQNHACNEAWLSSFLKNFSAEEYDWKPPTYRRVVVVVERIIQQTLSGQSELWLKITKRNDTRSSYRLPTFSDETVLRSLHPFFFFCRSSAPTSIDCVAEWVDGEWNLVDIFDPYADDPAAPSVETPRL